MESRILTKIDVCQRPDIYFHYLTILFVSHTSVKAGVGGEEWNSHSVQASGIAQVERQLRLISDPVGP